MKDTQALAFRRLSKPDEVGLMRIEVRAKNEIVAAAGEGLTSAKSLVRFAEILSSFPEQLPASASYSAACGSFDIAISLLTLDNSGHVGIKVFIQESATPQGNSATLWLKTQPSALMDLAQQLRRVADLASEVAELPA
jgi:hypothetical protein